MSSKHRLLRPSCISLRLAREKSSRDGEGWSKRGIIVATTKSQCRRATAGIASQWFKISLKSYVERSINAANHGSVFIQKYNALFIYNNTTYTKYKILANNRFFSFELDTPLLTFCGSSGGCSRVSGGLVLREGWMQTTSRSQPGAPGPGLDGEIGGAQGGVQDGASGGGRDTCSGESATSPRSKKINTLKQQGSSRDTECE